MPEVSCFFSLSNMPFHIFGWKHPDFPVGNFLPLFWEVLRAPQSGFSLPPPAGVGGGHRKPTFSHSDSGSSGSEPWGEWCSREVPVGQEEQEETRSCPFIPAKGPILFSLRLGSSASNNHSVPFQQRPFPLSVKVCFHRLQLKNPDTIRLPCRALLPTGAHCEPDT